MVGSLQYRTLTCLDVAYVVHFVCQLVHIPTDAHCHASNCIYHYLTGTIYLGLTCTKDPFLALCGFCDANWTSSRDNYCSTTKSAAYMGQNLLSWSAKKHNTISRLAGEVEYRDLVATITKLICFILAMNSPPPFLPCRNKNIINIAKNHFFHYRIKNVLK